MMTTLYDQMPEKKDVVGGLMGLPPVSDPMKSDQGKEALTPMSQVSTAPSTPALCALLPESSLGYDSDSLCSWSRQSSCDDAEVSPAAFTSAATSRSLATAPSLGAIEEELEEVQALLQRKIAQEIDSEEDVDSEEVEMEWVTSGQFHLGQTAQGLVTLSTLEEKLGEVRNLYKEKYGQDVDSESDIEVDLIDQDGTPWTCTVGSGLTVAALENKLEELKTLYREKYDQHVDSESDHEDDLIDEDGTPWICTPGSGLLTIAVLHEKLDEVKHLYEKKFGENVDSEIECDLLDSDGTPWMCTVASGPATMGALEERLEVLKNKYREKYGQDVDSESESDDDLVDEDGTPWICTIGSGPATIDALEEKLDELKSLYKGKFGQDVDSESECDLLDSDGTPWICTVGNGAATMNVLEEKLEEVKNLYMHKYGQDVDSDSESECDLVDEDGTPWKCTVGCGPATIDVLEEKLEEVKNMYKEKYGQDVDSESEIECDLLDSDGTPWIGTVGCGPVTMSVLEGKLDEVRSLYKEKYGQDVDSESDSEGDLVDPDGTPWICTIGSGPATMDALEEKLDELKSLYKGKYGRDVDSESEIECDLLDSDGTPWICTTGSGIAMTSALKKRLPAKSMHREEYGEDADSEIEDDLLDTDATGTMITLFAKLDELKTLYREKYGQDVDNESETDYDLVDSDGTPWIGTVGFGPATVDKLEQKLDEVKKLYKKKYGQDVDAESEIECDLLDSDGTPWICTLGSGPATRGALEERLHAVKTLYKAKYGQDVDSESDSDDDDDDLVDEDGTPWICTIGSGPATIDALEEKLDELKSLYKGKFGQDVDSESECDLLDSDGTPWICTVGNGAATMNVLEEKLEEVKNLYMDKYGQDVDSDSESECDLVDEDGTPWKCTVGCGPATIDVLEEKLEEVKNMYKEKYGQDVDSESEIECDLLDSDGTPWIGTVGCGPVTMSVLEGKLDEVRSLYKEKYGQDVDSEFDSEGDLVDPDGTPWICTIGSGPATMDALEEKLDELKSLYKGKYGRDVDSESEIECDLLDSDGTPWICTVGSGPATIEALEEELDKVKNMYLEKYGRDVDNESESEYDLLDSDGTPWIGTVGCGPATFDALERKLDGVKTLYMEKYGEDVDSESEIECDLLDSDGTPWIGTIGCGPTTMDRLEKRLCEVKKLYMEKYGQDVDNESEIDCDLLDSDGTPWIGTYGSGPATVSALEEKLDTVKKLYREKYGQDVDVDSQYACANQLVDEDGTPWTCTEGKGLVTITLLEEKLSVLKNMYKEKYGSDVATDSDDEDQ